MSQQAAHPHQPVLLAPILAVVEGLEDTSPYGLVDATVGFGGHSSALLATGRFSSYHALDQDATALAYARQRLAPQLQALAGPSHFHHVNFSQLPSLLQQAGPSQPLLVLMDLGISSHQLDEGARGFSFRQQAPLDMRMNPDDPTALTAAQWLATHTEAELADCLWRYGDERLARPIARRIMQRHAEAPLTTTQALAECARQVYARKQPRTAKGKDRIDPATRTFQALRIAVNDELGHLQRTLDALPAVLPSGSVVCVLSFHSLEDRVVKQWGQAQGKGCVCPAWFPVCQCGGQPTLVALLRKPATGTTQELQDNPRARSAKLRAYKRL